MTDKESQTQGKQNNTLIWILGIIAAVLILAICCAICVVAISVLVYMQNQPDSPLTGGSATDQPVVVEMSTATPVISEPPTAAPPTSAPPTAIPSTDLPPIDEPLPAEPVEITWFVGSTGSDSIQSALEEDLVEEFNNTHDDIILTLEVAEYDIAQEMLAVMIAAGDAPDIVGPDTLSSTGLPSDQWLDLSGYIEESGFDTSVYNPALMEIYNIPGQGQIALPYTVYPSAMFYNVDLFDEAQLCYPPEHYGEPYCDGDPWDWDKVREIGMLLTLDAGGNNATSQNFDPDNIVQYGLTLQWTDARDEAIFVGGNGSVWDGQGAAIPDNWRDAWHWHHDGIWEDHFITSQAAIDEMNFNPFSEGTIAMLASHSWYFCCIFNEFNWNIGALPMTLDGNLTASMHGSTFFIYKESRNPDAAWEVLSWMLEEKYAELDDVFSGQTARVITEDEYRAMLEDTFYLDLSDVNVGVLIEAQNYPDIPSGQTYLPNHSIADETLWDFYEWYQTAPVDMDAEIDALQRDLEQVFSD